MSIHVMKEVHTTEVVKKKVEAGMAGLEKTFDKVRDCPFPHYLLAIMQR